MRSIIRAASAYAACATLAHAQQSIPVRALVTVATSDRGAFGSITHIRALANGGVIVNDTSRRRLLLLDSTLTKLNVLADTAAGAANGYASARVALIRYVGDSSLFVDAAAGAMIVVHPDGKFGRVVAPPKQSDLQWLFMQNWPSGVDARGRLVYGTMLPSGPVLAPTPFDGSKKPVITRVYPDSGPILRSDFETRSVDTLAFRRVPPIKSGMISLQPQASQGFTVLHPLPIVDEWTVMPDGTIAIVRAHDYHVDWIDVNGTRTSSPKMPFAWKPLSQEDKQQLVDSARQGALARNLSSVVVVEPKELGDYYPPIRAGQLYADNAGNLWILPSTSLEAGSGLVFDVVNRSGVMVERVRLPQGRTLAGFGANGAVYLRSEIAPGSAVLERARVVR